MTNLSILYGEDIDQHVATSYRIRMGYQRRLNGVLVGINAVRSETNKTTFLGFDREDQTNSVNMSFELSDRVEVEIGYQKINSTINFFDYQGFTGNLVISPVFFLDD